MRFLITGCSGYVGQLLVPILSKMDMDLLLVGRDSSKLKRLFPKCCAISYDELLKTTDRFDAVVHLATINNKSKQNIASFERVNSDFALELVEIAKKLKVKKFFYFSSFHCLYPWANNNYVRSKRNACKKLKKVKGIRIQILYLPMVYGTQLPQKLRFLRHVPNALRLKLLGLFGALKPLVNAETIASHLTTKFDGRGHNEFVLCDDISQNVVYSLAKRVIDIAFCAFLFAGLFWLPLVIGLLVLKEDGRPIFLKQARVGMGQKIFGCFKFRTMDVATPHLGTHQVTENYITKVGVILRKTKIDELPQLINIIRNQMSVVGPRPCLPNQLDLIEHRKRLGVFDLKPGLTGYSQVLGFDMSKPRELALLDAQYIKIRSLFFDLLIIIKTIEFTIKKKAKKIEGNLDL